MEIESHHPFRVTRNADLTLEEEEADDLLVAVEMELRRRRFGRAVRLEVDGAIPTRCATLLTGSSTCSPRTSTPWPARSISTGLWAVYDLDRPDLKDEPFAPVTPARLATVTTSRSTSSPPSARATSSSSTPMRASPSRSRRSSPRR